MVRSAAVADRRNGLLQLTKRNQLSPGRSDQEAIDTGTDSAAPDDHQSEGQSVITQVLDDSALYCPSMFTCLRFPASGGAESGQRTSGKAARCPLVIRPSGGTVDRPYFRRP